MSLRKNRSPLDVYHREITGKLRRPNGGRWTKPKVIMETLESMLVKDRALAVYELYQFARKTLESTGDKGNIYLEFAWEKANKPQKAGQKFLSESDILTAHRNGEIARWYDALNGSARKSKTTAHVYCVNARRLRKLAKRSRKRRAGAPSAKSIGDAYRKECAEIRARGAEQAAKQLAEYELHEKFRAMLRDS